MAILDKQDFTQIEFEKSFGEILSIHTASPASLRPRQNGRHFLDNIFKCIFLNENVWIVIKISLKFVPKGPINNIPALVQIMVWCHPGDKLLSEPMVISLPTLHIYVPLGLNALTHWGRVTHICVGKLTNIGSDNGLSPGRRQAIIWTNAGILLIGTLGTNFSEFSIVIHTFSFNKMHLKMSSAKWRSFGLGLNVLRQWHSLNEKSCYLYQRIKIYQAPWISCNDFVCISLFSGASSAKTPYGTSWSSARFRRVWEETASSSCRVRLLCLLECWILSVVPRELWWGMLLWWDY